MTTQAGKKWNHLTRQFAIGILACSVFTASANTGDRFIVQGDIGLAAQVSTGLIDGLNARDGELSAALLISGGLYYENFFVEATPFGQNPLTIGYTLSGNDDYQISLVAQSWFQEISQREQEQGSDLTGLLTRRASFEAGIEYLTRYQNGDLRVRALYDGQSSHHGHLFIADYTYPVYAGSYLILPSVGVTYMSANAVDYYYGIEPREVTSLRPEYTPGSAWSVAFRLYGERQLSQHWTVFAFASYSHFSDAITDSPIVTVNDGIYNIAAGVLWSF